MQRIFLVLLISIFFSCESKNVIFDDSDKLEAFIKVKTGSSLNDSRTNSLLIILQNEDCICTDPDMQLTKELFDNEKFKTFKKILIVNKKNHKVFKKISKRTMENLVLIYNENNDLLNAGYLALTDRVIRYEKGKCSYYGDLHTKKPAVVKTELL